VTLELFDSSRIVHMEFTCIPHGATVNKDRYKEILIRLRDSIRLKRPELWRTKICQWGHMIVQIEKR
jgi:hypothetical protein